MLDNIINWIEASHETIPMSSSSKTTFDPDKGCFINKNVPGWKTEVEPLRKDALFWHAVWISSERPNTGALHSVMTHSRNKYHYAVRRVKKLSKTIRASNLLDAASKGDANLLKEMKNIKGKKKQSQTLLNNVKGAEGPDEILDKFREVYQALYNSAESVDAMEFIKTKINNLIGPDSLKEVRKVTGEVVKEACKRMKPGKNDVTEGFTSDVLLHAPDNLFENLAAIFRSFLVHGNVTLELLSCAFLPLLKSSLKDPTKTDSYRAIAGSSQVLKLMDNVVMLVWGDLLESDTLQFGFKPGTSTTQCSWLVMEVAAYFLRNGTSIISCRLDCSKAFDKYKFSVLFTKLLERNMPPIVIRMLIFIYEEQEGCIKLVGMRSITFRLTNGTRQGSVLSPTLFSVYLDDLLIEL